MLRYGLNDWPIIGMGFQAYLIFFTVGDDEIDIKKPPMKEGFLRTLEGRFVVFFTMTNG